MKCPRCGNKLRRSKKDPSFGLCDHCRKKFRWTEEHIPDEPIKKAYSKKKQKRTSKQSGISRIVISVILVVVLIGGFVLGKFLLDKKETNKKENNNPSSTSGTDYSNEDGDGIIDFTSEECNVSYLRHELKTDQDGNTCLLFYYTFSNSSGETASPSSSIYVQAFQNELACDTAIMKESIKEIDNYLKEIPHGESIEVCQAFTLKDTSDVIIETKGFMTFDGKTDTQILKIN